MASNHMSQDLWAEILKRVPVKRLCQCRCVCKSWNSLLASPFFHSHHLNFTASSTTETTFFQVHHTTSSRYCTPYYTLHHQDNRITSLDFPFLQRPHNRYPVIGVVHGVACLLAYFSDLITLWNPTIRKYMDIPWPYEPAQGQSCHFKGLGFDISKNDFKLVLSPFDTKETEVYYTLSVCEGVWRKKAFPHHLRSLLASDRGGCFLHGMIHWVASFGTYPLLLVFDCEREEFTTMDLPQVVQASAGLPHLFVYDGLLHLQLLKLGDHFDYCYEVWKMKGYGEVSSWAKHEIMRKDEFVFNENMSLMDRFVFKESLLLMDIGKPY